MYLTFSDAAKYADLARNLISGNGYHTSFSFFFKPFFTGMWIPPVMPFSIALLFKIFGVNDFAVVATSFIYFFLTLIFVFLLAKKVFNSSLTGILSTIVVAFNYDLLNYAKSGASEAPFIFEIVAGFYFVALRKKWANFVTIALLILMYFTRPQAFIYIAGIIFYYLLLNFKKRKAIFIFLITLILGFLIDKYISSQLAGRYFIYSILGRGANVLSQVDAGQSASNQLRSGVLTYNFALAETFKKIFYDLYNFYKLLPQIINPYLFLMFVVGLFKKENREFKFASLFIVVLTFLVAAAGIPFFRYIHPIIPFIYIISVSAIVWISAGISNNKKYVLALSLFLILFFGVGQTLGIFLLDSRSEKQTHNVGKPPVYVVLSQKLTENTYPNEIVITNLDTWGSWYGQRKTIWFPLEPRQLIDPVSGKIPFDAIYLTSYLIDDENYYMGNAWRSIFDNPNDPKKWICDGCSEIANEFKLKNVFVIDATENYEKQGSKAALFVKK